MSDWPQNCEFLPSICDNCTLTMSFYISIYIAKLLTQNCFSVHPLLVALHSLRPAPGFQIDFAFTTIFFSDSCHWRSLFQCWHTDHCTDANDAHVDAQAVASGLAHALHLGDALSNLRRSTISSHLPLQSPPSSSPSPHSTPQQTPSSTASSLPILVRVSFYF